jgi:hypothetical protein
MTNMNLNTSFMKRLERFTYFFEEWGPMNVRGVQKAFRFISPSLAEHRLERLRELRLVQHRMVISTIFWYEAYRIWSLRPF